MRTATIWMALAAATHGSAAIAYDPIVLAKGWTRIADDTAGDCRGEVGTNGQFYVIAINGLVPGALARLRIENGDMPPIDHTVRAGVTGGWQQYYIPFRPNRGEGGVVLAQVSAPDCALAFEFPWQRRKGWDERLPPENPYTR